MEMSFTKSTSSIVLSNTIGQWSRQRRRYSSSLLSFDWWYSPCFHRPPWSIVQGCCPWKHSRTLKCIKGDAKASPTVNTSRFWIICFSGRNCALWITLTTSVFATGTSTIMSVQVSTQQLSSCYSWCSFVYGTLTLSPSCCLSGT